MKYHLIYKITNKINGKIYIGQKSYNDIPSMENYYGGGTSIATKEAMSKPEIRAKVSDGLKKYYAEHPDAKPFSTLGKKWYNNGTISKFYFEGEQPDGWTLGRIKRRSK